MDWRDLVAANPPPGFDASDPSSPSYDFSALDASVQDAVAAGLEPLLVVSHAPALAEAPNRWPYAYPGSWAPSPIALQQFAQALATRYDGHYSSPLAPSQTLPRVSLFQAWNEPNLARYLEPQWVASNGQWAPFSPDLYREMLNGFFTGVKRAQPAATVVSAGVAPNGDPAGDGRMAPITFLRAMLCVDAHGRRIYDGCPEPPHFDVLAFHPLSVGDPDAAAALATDVAISDAAKVASLLRRAEHLRTALPDGAKGPMGHRAQLGKRAAGRRRGGANGAGAVGLARPSPAVDRGRHPGRLAVPRRPVSSAARRDSHGRADRISASRRPLQRRSRGRHRTARDPSRSSPASGCRSTRCGSTGARSACGRCSSAPVSAQRSSSTRATARGVRSRACAPTAPASSTCSWPYAAPCACGSSAARSPRRSRRSRAAAAACERWLCHERPPAALDGEGPGGR